MKKILLLATGFLPILCFGQTIVLSDDFESYTAGEPLAANSELWTTWSGGTEAEDANVSDAQANSGSNSVYIIGNTGPTDLLLPFPSDYTSGVLELEMKMYIVAGKGAYFNLQQSSVPGVAWMLEVYFDNAGGGNAIAAGTTVPVTYTPDTWTDIKVNVDLTNDLAELFINSLSVYSWQWSLGSSTGVAMWGGLNIYAFALNSQDAEFYVDDVVLTQIEVGACPEPTTLMASNITSTSALVQWAPASGALGYKLAYHAVGGNTKIKKPASTNSKKLTGLAPSTTYKWAVQTVCSNQPLIVSTFVPGPDFTTPPLRLGEETSFMSGIEIFPNPASENTTISFSLEEESPVLMRLIDLNGKVIREIGNASYSQGSHQVSFNSGQVATGVYLLQLTTNEGVETKKMVIDR